MAAFISVQLKKTSEVDLAKPLVKFIQQTYPSGGEEQAQYCRAAEELSKLRRAALGRPLDKHEGALETLLRWAWGRVGGGCRPPAACLTSSALPDSLTPTAGPAAPPRLGPARRCGLHSFLLQAPVTLPASPGCPPRASVLRGPVHRPPARNGPPRIHSLSPHLLRTSFLHFFLGGGVVCETPPFLHFCLTGKLCWPGWNFIIVIGLREVAELGLWNSRLLLTPYCPL